MVEDRKAFDGVDIESLRKSILESTPVPPVRVNGKVHPLLSDLIMKALEKDPSQRYQRGRELLDDLEKCKESKPQVAKKSPEAPKTAAVSDKQKVVAQSAVPSSLQRKSDGTPKAAAAAARAGSRLRPPPPPPQFYPPTHVIRH